MSKWHGLYSCLLNLKDKSEFTLVHNGSKISQIRKNVYLEILAGY